MTGPPNARLDERGNRLEDPRDYGPPRRRELTDVLPEAGFAAAVILVLLVVVIVWGSP